MPTSHSECTAKELAERFAGPGGERLIAQVMGRLPLLAERPAAAAELAAAGAVESFEVGDRLITQGAADSDILFILTGSIVISPNGRDDIVRTAPAHVGEMVAIDPTARRSASVKALEPTVALRVTEPDLTRIAEAHPSLWRGLAIELGERLRQRASAVAHRKDRARVFIASSSEALKAANELKAAFKDDPYDVHVWTDGIFVPGLTNIESLESELQRADFAVLLLSPDDRVFSRWTFSKAPRDNLILELGLFIGAIGRQRAIMAYPRSSKLKIPTDLLGVTPIRYPSTDMNFVASELRKIFSDLKAK